MNFFKKQQHQDPAVLTKQVDTSINITNVTIPKYRVKGNFVEYVIECTRNTTTWQVYRRYQQFKSLDAQLRALCPMGSPNHCEYGVVPVLAGSSWTEVTNQSPELVERRRRYLEIYLQQLVVPKNLFYAAKTSLFAFFHDGEVPVLYRTRAAKPLLGFGAVTDAVDGDDDEGDPSAPRQVVGMNRQQLIYPEAVVAAAVPDYSASSASRAQHNAGNAEAAAIAAKGSKGNNNDDTAASVDAQQQGSDDEPKPAPELGIYHEKCANCGHETEIDYDISEWTPLGRCPICKVHAKHMLVKPDGTIANAEDLDDVQKQLLSSLSAENICQRCHRPFTIVQKSAKTVENESRLTESPPPAPACADEGPSSSAPAEGSDGPQSPITLFCERCQALVDASADGRPGLVSRSATEDFAVPTSTSPSTQDKSKESDSRAHSPSSSAPPLLLSPHPSQVQHVVRTDVSIDDFTLITTLGRGTFGKVMKVAHKASGTIYAMKVLNKNVIHRRRMIDYIKEEKNIMSFLPPHPFVVTLHFAFQNDHHIFLVLDYLPGGELYTHIYPNRNLRESDARFYIAEVVVAVEHMHRFDVVHRDLKPENIVLDAGGHVKLTDFGLARMNFTNGRRRSFVGSAEYLAPETIQGDVQTKALDWWSVGVMLYEMLAGVAPFHANNNNDVYQGVLHKKLDLNKPCFTASAQNLISRLLEKDPKQRLQDPAKIRQHPFFSAVNWEALLARELTPPFVPDLGDNDTKYFSRDFTAEWATVNKPGGCGRQTLELLTRRFSNFQYVDERRTGSASPARRDVDASPLTGSPLSALNMSPDLINPECFVGVWRLVKVEMNTADGKVSFPWGSEVIGILVYCTNGMFQMQVCPMRRHKFRNPSQEKITRDEMADAYLTYVAMFGTYEVTPGTNFITHKTTGALCPNLVGIRERRFFELRDNQLLLSTKVMELQDGLNARTTITWERVAVAI